MIADRYSGYWDAFPTPDKTAESACAAFRDFLGPHVAGKYLYSDGSLELKAVAEEFRMDHGTSTPERPQTNGYVERHVRMAVEGARTVPQHAGLPPQMWTLVVRHFAFSSNVAIREGESAYSKRFGGEHFKGPLLPFGSLVTFAPPP